MEIRKDFEHLLFELTKEEYQNLEKSIIEEGCRDPLVLWNDLLIDGHNRYKICNEHGIKFNTVQKNFDSEEDAKIWMIDNQRGRRNLTIQQKLDMGFKRAELLKPKAEENQGRRTDLFQKSEKSYEPINTTAEAAKYAGVSVDTASKYKKIKESNNEELKQKLAKSEISINQGYSEIKSAEKKEKRKQEIDLISEKIKTEGIKPPDGKFDVIVIDPPWNYGREYDPDSSRVANPYPEMNQNELKKIEIPSKDNSVLFLWTTHAFIWNAKELLDFWGYTYKATIVWDKEKIGMGAWFRMQCEFCLVGIKGKPIWGNTKYRDIIRESRREHSRKPESFYKMVEEITAGRRLDYFSREKREGWICYGAEDGKFME